MTYCVAMRLDEGLICMSDTRTNGGVDHISTFRKLYTFGEANDRIIILQTSGNLATSQSVMTQINQQIKTDAEHTIMNAKTLYDAAEILGDLMRKTVLRTATLCQGESTNFTSSFLLSGQIKGQDMELYNIYPEGNFISASSDTPYFQIGESKYGKPILDRALNNETSLEKAVRCGLISFDSTIRSNLSVGMPIDMIVYKKDSFVLPKGRRITEKDPYFNAISSEWSEGLKSTLSGLTPAPEEYWE